MKSQIVLSNLNIINFWYLLCKFSSVATSSMIGYILGLGDRHVQNILIDTKTAEVIHIDFGICFEQALILRIPELVPFRLSRDIESGFGISGTEGVFKKYVVLINFTITIF